MATLGQDSRGALVAGAAVADDLPAKPGPRRRLADQFDENFFATVVAKHGRDGSRERGYESCDGSGAVLTCEHCLAHAEGDRGCGRTDHRSAPSPSSGRDADEPDIHRTSDPLA